MTTDLAALPKRPIPRKLNDGMIEALSEYVRKGNYPITACRLCDIEYSTFAYWMKYAEEDIQRGDENIYTQLYFAIKKAEADAEDLMVQTARNAAVQKKDGYLAITFNERRHPDRWGRKDRTQVDITEKKVIQITRITVVEPQGEIGQAVEGEAREILEGEE